MHATSQAKCALMMLAAGLMAAAPALGSPIPYGNLNGNTVEYQQITESSTTDDGTALFGTPSISGDSLRFSPMNFGITASDGAHDIMDGTLLTTLVATGGHRIEKLKFTERGDYTLAGPGGAGTHTQVTNTIFLTITDIDGGSIPPIEPLGISMTFTPNGGYYSLPGNAGQTIPWAGSVWIDVTALIDAEYPGQGRKATKLDIKLDNQLSAYSEMGTDAYIKKKTATGSAITVEAITPEPATVGLLLLGGLLLRRHR